MSLRLTAWKPWERRHPCLLASSTLAPLRIRIVNGLVAHAGRLRMVRASFGLALPAMIILSACPPPKPPEGKVVFVLFDASSSTQSEPVRKTYSDSFKRVLDRVAPGDRIIADAIIENPLSQSTFPINEQLPAIAPYDATKENDLTYKKRVEEQNKQITQRRDELLKLSEQFFTRSAAKTKILDSMQLAEKVFRNYAGSKRVLVVLSDMFEESDRYNFRKQGLDDQTTERIIGELKSKGQLANLSDVRVYVAGAGAGVYGNSPTERLMSVQSFWVRYFKEAGADLPSERYGAALISFEE